MKGVEAMGLHKGDVVRIKKFNAVPIDKSLRWDNSKLKHSGEVVVIEDCIRKRGKPYYYITNNCGCMWTINYFERVGKFKKKDLRDGMTVQTRNGNVYLVVHKMLIGEKSFIDPCRYDDDLKYTDNADLDIVNVCDVYRENSGFYIKDILKKRGTTLTKNLNGIENISFNEAVETLKKYCGCSDVRIKMD